VRRSATTLAAAPRGAHGSGLGGVVGAGGAVARHDLPFMSQ
jgi:hypothetical protein